MNGTSRFDTGRWLLLASAFALFAALAGPLAGGNALAGTDDPPFDLAAMALLPADVEDEGMEGYGLSWSLLGQDSEAIAEFVEDWGWDAEVDDGKAFREAGADRSYLLHISRDIEVDGWVYSPELVASFVLEYDDADAAEEGFAAALDIWDDDLDVLKPEAEIGDEQALIAGTGVDTSTGDEYERMLFLFRIDNLVSGVSMHDYANENAPAQAVVEALAERQAERIDDAQNGDAPGLSGQVVRLRLDGRLTNWDYYTAMEGRAIRLNTVDETEAEYAERQAEYDELGMVERYHLEQIVAEESPTGDVYAWYNATIDRFEDEDAASAFMSWLLEQDETETVVSTPKLGDEAIAYASVTSAGNDRYRVMVRTGDVVFRLSHVVNADAAGNPLEPQPEAINDLAERQMACLEGERSCERPVRVPAEMQMDGGDQAAWLFPVVPVIARREVAASQAG